MFLGQVLNGAISTIGKAAVNSGARALGGNPNAISAAAQQAQGDYNWAGANMANDLGTQRLMELYGFNSGQAASANQFTLDMWERAAAWNEMMWQKQADWNEKMWNQSATFNKKEAQKNRDWQQMMAETSYQRAVADMKAAGLNPILATGGVNASAGGSGSAASIGMSGGSAPTMGGATGQMASGSAINGIAPSESSYTGQLDYLSGMLGLMSTIGNALSSAWKLANNNPVVQNFYNNTIDAIDKATNHQRQKSDRDKDIQENGAVNRYFRKLP